MSRFKVNTNVVVKATGEKGIVKGCEVKELPNGKTLVEYVVKFGEGLENWKSFTKKELKKVVDVKEEKEIPFIVVDAPNGYKITLVGLVETFVDPWSEYFENEKRKSKRLCIGYSIHNPNDKYDLDLGMRIARHRAETAPFFHAVSSFTGEFNKETVYALLHVKGDYISANINNFIKKQ